MEPQIFNIRKQTLLAGAGWVKEQVKTIRYGSADPQHQYTSYAFAQYTFKPMDLKEVNLGLRYDQNNVYGGQLSPKISFTTPIRKNITWNGSLGLGFKAPDFRQLYLDFNNAAGGGYSVLGREVLTSKLAFLQQQGRSQDI
ncbi:MAG: TonB-dependent receptor [Saprospiraceae bacterium]|nr:TonB-dependent receptor [Saprospiraceae bacterium]